MARRSSRYHYGFWYEFPGTCWNTFSAVYGAVIIHAPSHGHYQIGLAERHGSLIKKSYDAIDSKLGKGCDVQMKMAIALLDRNSTPTSGSHLAPIAALTGTTQILEDLQWAPLTKYDTWWVDSHSLWKRPEAVRHAQADIVKFEDQRSIDICLRRNKRVGENDLYRENDRADSYLPGKQKWTGAYRILCDSGSNVAIEGDKKVPNHEKARARLRSRVSSIISPPLNPSGDQLSASAMDMAAAENGPDARNEPKKRYRK